MDLHTSRVLLAIAVGVAALAPSHGSAQLSTTRGVSLGVHVQGTSLSVEGNDAHGGGGLGVQLGYGFNRIVTGFIQLDGSRIDIPVDEQGSITGDWALAHAELGVRFHFANSLRRWVPYVETSLGSRAVSVKNAEVRGQTANDISFSGGAFTFGTGLSAYLKETMALDVSLKWTGGEFTKIDVGNLAIKNLEVDANSFRFGLGIVWWP
ncbi:MAG: hypothetical protein MNPFHGCM_00252 [Gemmatimonadaceae bacterium]|nr:hypothetical protein [Gemmatimonadaceae bacterium]